MTEVAGKLFIVALFILGGILIRWLLKRDQKRAEQSFIDAQREAAEAARAERDAKREERWGEW